MLDKKSLTLLQTINDLCPNGVYEILTAEDITSALPKKFKINDKELRAMIDDLTAKKLVSVKYSDEHEYCLAPLPDGKMKCEQQGKEEATAYDVKKGMRKTAFLCFFASLFGSAIGGAIVYVICRLL